MLCHPGLHDAGNGSGGIHGADCSGGKTIADGMTFGKIAGKMPHSLNNSSFLKDCLINGQLYFIINIGVY